MVERKRKMSRHLRIELTPCRSLDPRNDLNTICQRLGMEWYFETTCENPRTHRAEHLAICYSKCSFTSMMVTSLTYTAVNGEEYSRGYGGKIKDAENAAARDAVEALRQEFPGVG